MKEEIKQKLQDEASALGTALFNIRNSFFVWRQIMISINSTATNSDFAEESLKLLNMYKGFFIPVLASLEHHFNVELFTFICKKDEKSLPKLINQLKSQGFDHSNAFEEIQTKHADTMEKIKSARDKIFAHKDRKFKIEEFKLPSIVEYENLINDLQKIMEVICSSSLGFSIIFFEDESAESFRDTNIMLETIYRGEEARKTNHHSTYRTKLLEHYSLRKKQK